MKRAAFLASAKLLTSSVMASMRATVAKPVNYVGNKMKEETEVAIINKAIAKRERKNAKRLKHGL